MARPKIDDFWVERINGLLGRDPHMSGAAIRRKLINNAKFKKEAAPTRVPSERAIRHIKEQFNEKTEAERRKFQYFTWPETMQAGVVPWEASRSCLDLLAYLREHIGSRPDHIPDDVWKLLSADRPRNDFIEWYWVVTQAAPNAPMPVRLLLTASVRIRQFRQAEGCIAYAPWESEAQASAYAVAIAAGKIPPFTEVRNLDVRLTLLFHMFGTDDLKDIKSAWEWLATLSGCEPSTTREVMTSEGPGILTTPGFRRPRQQKPQEKGMKKKGQAHGR